MLPEVSIEGGSGSKESYVVAGAILSCSMGSSRSRLTMPVSHGVYIRSKAQMNIKDHISIANIMPFGVCKVTKAPCVPVTPMPWMNGKEDTLVEGQPALLNICTLTCTQCGLIKIDDDGQA